MAEVDVQIEGLDRLVSKFSKLPDKAMELVRQQALKDAEELAGRARANCVVDTGFLRESIQSFCEVEDNAIVAGARTNNPYAIFVEFGTGPVGTQSGGHPLDNELGVTRKTEGWVAPIPNVGFRYLEGQPAKPFLYPAMKEMEEVIKEHFGSAIKEALR